jgi:hypothetical protein
MVTRGVSWMGLKVLPAWVDALLSVWGTQRQQVEAMNWSCVQELPGIFLFLGHPTSQQSELWAPGLTLVAP